MVVAALQVAAGAAVAAPGAGRPTGRVVRRPVAAAARGKRWAGLRSPVRARLRRTGQKPSASRGREIARAARLLGRRGTAGERAVVGTIMMGMGTPARDILAAERTLPAGRWRGQRLIISVIMVEMKVSLEKIARAERTIPRGRWPSRRGVVAAVMAAAGVDRAAVEKAEQNLSPGLWARGDQRVVVAALMAGFGLKQAAIERQIERLPAGRWRDQRAVIAANLAAMEGAEKGLAPADAARSRRLGRAGWLRRP